MKKSDVIAMAKDLLQCCLYFTANSLARVLTTMAEEEFKKTGLAPNYAFLLMLVCEKPGIMQKEMGQSLQLTPSTITRFVDKLEAKGLVRRTVDGKMARLDPTSEGMALLEDIHAAWSRLYCRYSDILGEKAGQDLTQLAWQATLKLEGK